MLKKLSIADFWQYLLVFLQTSFFFIIFASQRLVAQDEGFYLFAAKLISEGNLPYLDFFYPQAPLLPFVYGIFFKILGPDLLTARIITALISATLGLLIFIHIKKNHDLSIAVIAVILFTLSNFVLANLLVVQTYALSVILLFLSYLFFTNKCYLLSALILGLCIQTRLTFAIILPIYLVYLFLDYRKQQIAKSDICKFCLVFLLSLLPSLYFILLDASSFWFNNIGYHQLRTTLSPEDSWDNKLTVLKVIFGLKDSVKFSAWQLPLLIYIFIITVVAQLIWSKRLQLSSAMIFGLLLIHLLPEPTYVQYFVVLIPFLIINLAELTIYLHSKKIILPFLTLFSLVYLWDYPEDYQRYTKTGNGVIGIMNQENAEHWSIDNIQKIIAETKVKCNPQKLAWSYWPGYLLSSNCQVYPGSENHFSYLVVPKLTKEQKEKYHLANLTEINDLIQAGAMDLIISADTDRRRHQINFNQHYQQQNQYFWQRQ